MPYTDHLRVAVAELGATLHVRLTGEFDLAGVGAVESELDRGLEPPRPSRVLIDLSGLRFLDLAGLRTILRADARGRADGFEVVIIRPRGFANRVFTLTRAGEQLSMVDAVEAA